MRPEKEKEKVYTVSIPQAVGTVATRNGKNLRCLFKLVSIPQAVGTVATHARPHSNSLFVNNSFNTASGRHCCNK